VGDGLWSTTTDVSVYKLSSPAVCLIDTPGINHTTKADAEILKSISDFILNMYVKTTWWQSIVVLTKGSYKRRIRLAGLFYFHSITDNRIGVSSGNNLYYIQELVGKDFKRVVVITTMWDQIDSENLGKTRETELVSHWKDMIIPGTSVRRFLRTRESALAILSPIFAESSRKPQGKPKQEKPKAQRKQQSPEQLKQEKLEAKRKQEALKAQQKQEKLEAKRKQEALKAQQKQEKLEEKRKQEALKAQQKQEKLEVQRKQKAPKAQQKQEKPEVQRKQKAPKAHPRQESSKAQRTPETPKAQPRQETVQLQSRQEIEVQRREEVIEVQPRQKTVEGQRGQEGPKAQRKPEAQQKSKNRESNQKSGSCCVIM